MPTFEEKCPEFGQKIRVNVRCEDLVFLRYDCGNYICHSETFTYYYKSEVKWTPTSEEPQWTQITEDESTWPPLNKYVAIDSSLIAIRYKDTNVKRDLIGQFWTHIPTRKKEEKPYISDKSIDQLKRAETEARLCKLERKADEFDDFIRSQKRKESSPWKSTHIKPSPGSLILVRKGPPGPGGVMKIHEYWKSHGLDSLYETISNENFITYQEWMEIPK